MAGATTTSNTLDQIASEFTQAKLQDPSVEIDDFLPNREDPDFLDLLGKLICVDIKLGFDVGTSKELRDYVKAYPFLRDEQSVLGAIAYTEYRSRTAHAIGNAVEKKNHSQALGQLSDGTGEDDNDADSIEATRVLSDEVQHGSSERSAHYNTNSEDCRISGISQWIQHSSSHSALEHRVRRWRPGDRLLDFVLLEKLGKGTFGDVFKATQGDLAKRYVVLKIGRNLFGEAECLAELQHTNIVPIYSRHECADFQIVCMPFFGSTTLEDVLRDLNSRTDMPTSSDYFLNTCQQSSLRTDRTDSQRDNRKSRDHSTPRNDVAESIANLNLSNSANYMDAVLCIISQLAKALSHAHANGIVHRDIKPANILLADDGRPMLLDFNLSLSLRSHRKSSRNRVAGTIPYMAPEQLDATLKKDTSVDARSDIYALGIVFCRLLIGESPFPQFKGTAREVIEKQLAHRVERGADVDEIRRNSTPAVAEIVAKCLEPDVNSRYQTAGELLEDIERQRANRPLKHARERSTLERVRKFQKRHPRLLSLTSVLVFALFLTIGLLGLWHRASSVASRLEAKEKLHSFQSNETTAQFLLISQSDVEQRKHALEFGYQLLKPYKVLQDKDWQNHPAVRELSKSQRDQLLQGIGDLLLMMAAVESHNHSRSTPQPSQLRHAKRLCRLSEKCYANDESPQLLWTLRATLAVSLKEAEFAKECSMRAAKTPLRGAKDSFLAALHCRHNGRIHDAMALLEKAAEFGPREFEVYFLKGVCHDEVAQHRSAISCYQTCIALQPKAWGAWHNKGLALLRIGRHQQAIACFDAALRINANYQDAFINRALALQELGKNREAIDNLNKALALGSHKTRIYFMRSSVRKKLGDEHGAQSDHRLGMQSVPQDELSWIARGLARISNEPKLALKDFDAALQCNPRSLAALQNKAHVLAEHLNAPKKSIATLDQAIALYADAPFLYSGRGVMHARLGNRNEAHRDARTAIDKDSSPAISYQVGCIYALTSGQNSADRLEAFRWLSMAIRGGFEPSHLTTDADLKSLRNHQEFQRIVRFARSFHTPKNRNN